MAVLVEAIRQLGRRKDLKPELAEAAVAEIMEGSASDAAIAAFLTGLRVKGETAGELLGAVRAVRARMATLDGPLPATLDTCGTGGDGANILNVSTAAALVVAACGVPVAKHGNRSASGNSGSAEVLTELGVSIEMEPARLAEGLREFGITFLFAPRFHPALRFAAAVRRQLPFRTLFNLIGPLANPARPAYQLVGVPDRAAAYLVASTLANLGGVRAAVVTGHGGLDEVSLDGPTRVLWVEPGRVSPADWNPEEFGLEPVDVSTLRVSGPAESAEQIRRLIASERVPARAIVLANAAAALRVVGAVDRLADGVARAAEAIDSGAAAGLLERWRGWGPHTPAPAEPIQRSS